MTEQCLPAKQKLDTPKYVWIYWSDDGQQIRYWTRDRKQAINYLKQHGGEMDIYISADAILEIADDQ